MHAHVLTKKILYWAYEFGGPVGKTRLNTLTQSDWVQCTSVAPAASGFAIVCYWYGAPIVSGLILNIKLSV